MSCQMCRDGVERVLNSHRGFYGLIPCSDLYEAPDKQTQRILDRLDGSGF